MLTITSSCIASAALAACLLISPSVGFAFEEPELPEAEPPIAEAAGDENGLLPENLEMPGELSMTLTQDSERPLLWFPVGERLIYAVRWGPFKVATTVVSSRWVEEGGRELIEISARTKSTPFFDGIYKVDDTIESLVDPVGFTPVRFTKILNEGRNNLHEITTFDHVAGTACWSNAFTHATKDLKIQPDTRCLLSFMFYMRLHEFVPGVTERFKLMADENIHELDVLTELRERIDLPGFGRVNCLLLKPEAPFHGLFVRVGKIRIWISDDDRSLCAQASAGILVGSIFVRLQRVEGPGNDLWTRRERS